MKNLRHISYNDLMNNYRVEKSNSKGVEDESQTNNLSC
jgi:hypothetical protein